MGVFRAVKSFFRPVFDIGTWLDYKRLKGGAGHIWDMGKQIFVPQKADPEQRQNFEQMVAELNLTEDDLRQRQRGLLGLAIFYALMALGLLGYFVYLLMSTHYRASFIAFGIALAISGFAFRQHFWYFQVKHRVLGVSFREWLRGEIAERTQETPAATGAEADEVAEQQPEEPQA